MNCNKANDYFMKYMDGCLSEDEAASLNKHLGNCHRCAEDFSVYDSIMTEFSHTELCVAPDDLEVKVMAAIEKLPPVHAKVEGAIDKMLWVVLGAFTVLLGIGIGMFAYRDALLDMMASSAELAPYAQMLAPVSNFVTEFTMNIEQVFANAMTWASSFVGEYKYVVLAASLGLFVLQFLLYRRDKVEG